MNRKKRDALETAIVEKAAKEAANEFAAKEKAFKRKLSEASEEVVAKQAKIVAKVGF